MSKNKEIKQGTFKSIITDARSYVILVGFTLLTALITYILYKYTEDLLTERLKKRILAIVTTASIQFEVKDIEAVREYKDRTKPEFFHLVTQLKKIQESNENIKFIYLMRPTAKKAQFEFVADSQSLNTDKEQDFNGNGVLDDDEKPPQPGDPFDASEYPELAIESLNTPTVEKQMYVDQWSVSISAYAPIIDDGNKTVAVLGIDIQDNDFAKVTRETFLPFLLFLLFFILLLILLTLLLVRIWRERVEAIRELDRQKDELLGIVSHQLAAPVTSLKWYLEMLAEGDLGSLQKEQKESITTMQGVALNLADLVSMILDVSRIQLGRIKIDASSLDLNQFFKEIVATIEPKAKEKDVSFSISIPQGLPTVMLDKRYTRMTIENLLTNAVKYTPTKGSVSFKVEKREDGQLYCEVKDTGCGIPKADQDKIFGKLFRASNVRNTVDGNGFGLYVAKGAIEAQGGKIWFESTENMGTTFFISLPLKTEKTTCA
jgi:signal transduction histidine kinase